MGFVRTDTGAATSFSMVGRPAYDDIDNQGREAIVWIMERIHGPQLPFQWLANRSSEPSLKSMTWSYGWGLGITTSRNSTTRWKSVSSGIGDVPHLQLHDTIGGKGAVWYAARSHDTDAHVVKYDWTSLAMLRYRWWVRRHNCGKYFVQYRRSCATWE